MGVKAISKVAFAVGMFVNTGAAAQSLSDRNDVLF